MICTDTAPTRYSRPTPRLSIHAVQRWRERAQLSGRPQAAFNELAEFVRSGHRRPTPRNWTTVRPAPGLTFVYWAERPDVCALVVDETVVTVLTRYLCKRRRRTDPMEIQLPFRQRSAEPTVLVAA